MAVTEKRPLDDNVYSTKHIVMDIEGTTTSISFVKETLFPYVRQNLDAYLASHWEEDEFKSVLALLKDQASEDLKANLKGAVGIPSEGSEDDVKAAIAKNILWQMDTDRKTTALKKLQGHMWRQGYQSGELKGHLFGDVAPALREWVNDGRKLYVYSSGSVEAQKLLFGNSADGDLVELFTDFFDTEVGAKVDADSYKSILKKLECNGDDVLFLTDMPKEASAAREAGLPVVLVEREGNEPIDKQLRKEYSTVSSFREVSFQAASKKLKIEDNDSKTSKSEVAKCDTIEENAKPAEECVPAMDVDPAVDLPLKADSSVLLEAMEVASQADNQADQPASEPEADKGETDVKAADEGSSVTMDIAKKSATEVEFPSEMTEETSGTATEQLKEGDEGDQKVTLEEADKKMDVDITVVPEKTDEQVTQQKTEEKVSNEVGKGSENPLSKDLMKTDETEKKPEAVTAGNSVELEDELVSDVEKNSLKEIQETAKEENISEDDKKSFEDNSDSVCVEDLVGSETNIITEPEKLQETEVSESEKTVEKHEVIGSKPHANDKETEKVASDDGKEMTNGTTNGTSNGTKDADTNGTVENGHAKEEKDNIPEVIIPKNASQIDGGSAADAGVVVEA